MAIRFEFGPDRHPDAFHCPNKGDYRVLRAALFSFLNSPRYAKWDNWKERARELLSELDSAWEQGPCAYY